MHKKMIKTGGDVAKGLIDKSGKVADKMLAKGGDFSAGMMQLTSKLSDDIGVMADRILQMADKIGEMAERIERTEALLAKVTAVMADKDIDLSPLHTKSKEKTAPSVVLLDVDTTEATEQKGPGLSITGDPGAYLLYLSASPLFPEGQTVISRVRNQDDYAAAWRRSMRAIKEATKIAGETSAEIEVVAIAVKTEAENNQLTLLSNSIDITINK